MATTTSLLTVISKWHFYSIHQLQLWARAEKSGSVWFNILPPFLSGALYTHAAQVADSGEAPP